MTLSRDYARPLPQAGEVFNWLLERMDNISESNDPPKLACVVLTHNDTRMTVRCLESLYETTPFDFTAIVVDDGSDPRCDEPLEEQFPDIQTMRHDEALGFATSANAGIRWALANDAEYILLLNNDTVIGPDAVERVLKALQENPEAGAATPVILDPGPERIVQFSHSQLRPSAGRHVSFDHGRPLAPDHQRVQVTEFAPACATMYRAETLEEVGLFDERLFMFWEDYDWCMRLHRSRWKMLSVGTAQVVHTHGGSSGQQSPFTVYYMTRNRLICLFRYARLDHIGINLPRVLQIFWWQMKNYGLKNWACHRAWLRGVRHFFFGVRGKGHRV